MKPTSFAIKTDKKDGIRRFERGFALVISLTLMVLLTVLSVGLLTLSAISLRTSTHSEAMLTARSNARLALMLAIGQLQKSAGPDQRITAPANLVDENHPMGVTGVWKSWKPDPAGVAAGDYRDRKTGNHFLGYLLSDSRPSASPETTELPAGEVMQELVGEGSLGSTAAKQKIAAEVVLTTKEAGSPPDGGFAWTAMDEGVKGRIDLEPAAEASSLGEQITAIGSSARNRFDKVKGLEFLDTTDETELRELLPKLVSLGETELKSSSAATLGEYFHDYTVASSSVQANVAEGGLKTDLSVLFDGNYGDALPSSYASRYLYSNTSSPFPTAASNSDIQWSLYANHARLYRLSNSTDGSALTGLKAKLPPGYQLKNVSDSSAAPAVVRYEPRMSTIKRPVLMPTVVKVDTVFSVVAHTAHAGRGTSAYPYQLHMMYLPVITLHNPYNTTLRCTNFQVEFSDIPVGFEFRVNGQAATTSGLIPLNNLYHGDPSGKKKTFSVTLSNSLTSATEVVMGPGETRIFGTPFSKDATWGSEVAANGAVMFDWQSNKTGNVKMIPGMMTPPEGGIGFDVDFLAPDPRAAWANSRINFGVLLLAPTDRVEVRFGPTMPASAGGALTITTKMATQEIGRTQVFYKNQASLTPLLSEGVSPRFPATRSFPAIFPDAGSPPVTATQLLEADGTPFKSYKKAKPFAIFSVSAKTTVEAFTKARPVADTGMVFQMATSDFRNTTTQGSSPLEMALVPVKSGSAAIEVSGPNLDRGFFFGGHGSTNGTPAATLYEIPLAPLQSIAHLRNANAASLGAPPLVTYSVGESRAHPAIPPDAPKFQPNSSTLLLDHSWLANSALWDGYWFSSLSTLQGPAYPASSALNQAELAARFFGGERSLPNPRNAPYFPAGKPATPEDAAVAAVAAEGKNSAAYIMTEGGFNVNSTSVAAWIAVLSSLADSEVPLVVGNSEISAGSPFPRVRRPVSGANNPAANSKDKLWNSYRALTAAEIKTLAENIVAEVRIRGPFLSMSEFVNRRIGPADELTHKGALQAALDRDNLNALKASNARPVAPADVAGYGWKNPDTISGNTGAGAPGEISQGDLLSVIGSVVSVRSDTFRVRGYGDARDPAGKIIAKAWCEATVQRVPEFIDPADAPEAAPASPANVRFGRRFKVAAFRWLAPGEV